MNELPSSDLLYFDTLSLIMIGLVGFVGICVAAFSSRYLKGDSQYSNFFIMLALIILSVFVMVSANHIALFLLAWLTSNALLVRLMVYKPNWREARNSGYLAAKSFGLGFICLSAALGLLAFASGEQTIQGLLNTAHNPLILGPALCLILIAAMTQSALWPCHRWLISSLNSPTPVSAIMHAGLVNGGGFLLARFAPLYFTMPDLLTIVFIVGFITAPLGTLWKLMQSDIKRMLACSTMGQMGFMIAQCGMGLFPAAIAHLCWHGLFKAYLFLASGSAAQEQRLDLGYPPSAKEFAIGLICGIFATFAFIVASGKDLFAGDTTLILIALAFMAGTQFALSIVKSPIVKSPTLYFVPVAIAVTTVMGGLYGLSIYALESLLSTLDIAQPQTLNIFHMLAIGLLILTWLGMLFYRLFYQKADREKEYPKWMIKSYVRMLNASQPHPNTVTAHKNHYQV